MTTQETVVQRMLKSLKKRGITYHLVNIIPFDHVIDGKIPVVNDACVFYGSVGGKTVCEKYGWKPGYWTSDEMDETNVAEKLGELALNSDLVVAPLADALSAAKSRGWDSFFVKPNADTKEFAGILQTQEEFGAWLDNLLTIGYLESNDFDVVVSEPKTIQAEYRVLIVNGQVIDFSLYKIGRQVVAKRTDDADVCRFVNGEVIPLLNPCMAYMVDVARTDKGLKVIEYNTFNSAGLYAIDVDKAIMAIERCL
jgi:hypothetical protein